MWAEARHQEYHFVQPQLALLIFFSCTYVYQWLRKCHEYWFWVTKIANKQIFICKIWIMQIDCSDFRQLFRDVFLQNLEWSQRSYFILLLIIWVTLQCVFKMRGLAQYREKLEDAEGRRTNDQAKSPIRWEEVKSKSSMQEEALIKAVTVHHGWLPYHSGLFFLNVLL